MVLLGGSMSKKNSSHLTRKEYQALKEKERQKTDTNDDQLHYSYTRRSKLEEDNSYSSAEDFYEDSYEEERNRSYESPTRPTYEKGNQQKKGNKKRPSKKYQQPKGKVPKVKKQKKHHFLRNLLLILLVISGLIFWRYGAGVKEAKKAMNGEKAPVETFNGVTSSDGSTNILLVGSDQRPSENVPSRSDTLMILHLAKGQKQPKLLSIMRDTYVEIPGYGNNKINAAYAFGGAELLRQTIKNNFDIDLKYYLRVDFQSFEDVIDVLYPKGVFIDAEKEINLDGVTITKGPQNMNGHVLLQYARFRKDEEGDFGRVRRQQQVINALIAQGKNPLTLLHLPKAMGAAMTYTSTDLSIFYGAFQGMNYLIKGASGVDRLTIPVDGSWSYGNYAEAGSVIQIDFAKNKEAINQFFNS